MASSSSSRNKPSRSCLHYRSSPDPYSSSSSSTFASSSTSTFSTMFSRASSPTRVAMYSGPTSTTPFSRASSPGRVTMTSLPSAAVKKQAKRTCMCSPTNHPGSFRCSLHKGSASHPHHHPVSYQARSLNFRRSAMTNSLVRIGGVEGGDLVKRALAALIRPSSHQQRRRSAFHPRPSRLSRMSVADCDRDREVT